jgi:hypothetical protein
VGLAGAGHSSGSGFSGGDSGSRAATLWWVRPRPPSDEQRGDVHSKVLLLRRSGAQCSGSDDLVLHGGSSGEVWSGGGPSSLMCWWSASAVVSASGFRGDSADVGGCEIWTARSGFQGWWWPWLGVDVVTALGVFGSVVVWAGSSWFREEVV